MINEVALVAAGAMITWLLTTPDKAAEHRIRQTMDRQINDEQIESHRNTTQSIFNIFRNVENISQTHLDLAQRIRNINQRVTTSISDSMQAVHGTTLRMGEVAQDYQQASMDGEQQLQLSTAELEQIIAKLSRQLQLANDTIQHSLNRTTARKIIELEEENLSLKSALSQALSDFEIIMRVNETLRQHIQELEEKYSRSEQASTPLTMC